MSKSLSLAHDDACTEIQARALLAASRELLAIVSQSGEFLFVNDNFFQVLGYLPQELIGKSLLYLHAASDAARIQEKFASIVASRDGDSVACRCSLRAKSGQFRRPEIRSAPMRRWIRASWWPMCRSGRMR